MEFDYISVCVDCVQYLANGTIPDDNEAHHAIVLGLEKARNEGFQVCFDGEDDGFSSRPCDLCERKLGGDRFKAALLPASLI